MRRVIPKLLAGIALLAAGAAALCVGFLGAWLVESRGERASIDPGLDGIAQEFIQTTQQYDEFKARLQKLEARLAPAPPAPQKKGGTR